MKITKIEIKNFKGFSTDYAINLTPRGKNLLIYGENGSGKSSLVQALQYFIQSSAQAIPFGQYQNIFEHEPGYVKLKVTPTSGRERLAYEWSEGNSTHRVTSIIEAAKVPSFMDYKGLLQTYLLQPRATSVNVFNLLVENVLANSTNPITDNTFAEDWQSIADRIPQRNTGKQISELQTSIDSFNQGMMSKLEELRVEATIILQEFEHNVMIDFEFSGVSYQRDTKSITDQQITLIIDFYNRPVNAPWQFLNEARLSAITLSIYLASLLLVPSPDLKILVLDDILIGLDMSNRFPVLRILDNHFSDYQIILTTYDKLWYRIVKNRVADRDWQYVEMYAHKTATDHPETSIIKTETDYIQIAREHFENSDYKAAAVYIRSEFERVLRKYCDKKGVPVKYRTLPYRYSSEDFWKAIKDTDEAAITRESPTIIGDVELWRDLIMNALSHHDIQRPAFRTEVQQAIQVVEDLRQILRTL